MQSSPELFKARHRARCVTKELSIEHPSLVVLEDLAMARGVLVLDGGLEGAEARLVRKGNDGIIRVRSGIPERGRRRFAIAHELGHWELHANVSQWALCSAGDIGAYSGSAPELEANAFAAELLMPTVLLSSRCENVRPNLDLIGQLADEFETSFSATAVRFVEECREKCAVVFSRDQRVRWWRAREDSRLWIAPGLPLDPRSNASQVSGRTVMEPVPTEAWFPNRYSIEPWSVYEQSVALGGYDTVMTLLWVIEEEPNESDDDDDTNWSRSLR